MKSVFNINVNIYKNKNKTISIKKFDNLVGISVGIKAEIFTEQT